MHYFWPCFHCACTEIVRPAFLAAGETSDTCKFGLDVPLSLKAHYFGGFRTFAVDFLFLVYAKSLPFIYFCLIGLLICHAGSAVKVLVAIQYTVLVVRNGYIRNVVV